jgi:hypothetical protein
VFFGLFGLMACGGNCGDCVDPDGLSLGDLTIPLPSVLADLLVNDRTPGIPGSMRLESMLGKLSEMTATRYDGYTAADSFGLCSTRSNSAPTAFSPRFRTCAGQSTTISTYHTCVQGLTSDAKERADLNYCVGKYAATGTLDEYETCLLRMERCSAENTGVWAWMQAFNASNPGPKPFQPAGIVIAYQGESDPRLLLIKVPNRLNKSIVEGIEELDGLANLIGQPIDAKSKRASRDMFAIEADMRMKPFSIDPQTTNGCELGPITIDVTTTIRGFTFWLTRLDLEPGRSMTSRNQGNLPDAALIDSRYRFATEDELLDPEEHHYDSGYLLGARIQVGHFNFDANLASAPHSEDFRCSGKLELLVDFRVGFTATGEMTLTPVAKKLYLDDSCSPSQIFIHVNLDVEELVHKVLVKTVNKLGEAKYGSDSDDPQSPRQHFVLAFDGRIVTAAKDSAGHELPPFAFDDEGMSVRLQSEPREIPRHFLSLELKAREANYQIPGELRYTAVSPRILVTEAARVRDGGAFETGMYSHAIPLLDRIEREDTELLLEVGCAYREESFDTGPWIPDFPYPELPWMVVPIDQFSAIGTSLINLPQIVAPVGNRLGLLSLRQAELARASTVVQGTLAGLDYSAAKRDFSEEWAWTGSQPLAADAAAVVTPVDGAIDLPFDPLDVLCTEDLLSIRRDSLMVDLQARGYGNQIRVLGSQNVRLTQENWFYTFSGRGHLRLGLQQNPRMTVQASTTPRPRLTDRYLPSTKANPDLFPTTGNINFQRVDPATRRFESISELPTIQVYGTQTNANGQPTGQGMPLASWSISGFKSRDEQIELPFGVNRDDVVIQLTYPQGDSLYPDADKLQLTLSEVNMDDGLDRYRANGSAVGEVLVDPTRQTMLESAPPTNVFMKLLRLKRQN